MKYTITPKGFIKYLKHIQNEYKIKVHYGSMGEKDEVEALCFSDVDDPRIVFNGCKICDMFFKECCFFDTARIPVPFRYVSSKTSVVELLAHELAHLRHAYHNAKWKAEMAEIYKKLSCELKWSKELYELQKMK